MNQVWNYGDKFVYTYDQFDNQTSFVYYYWDENRNDWLGDTFSGILLRTENLYNENNDPLLEAIYDVSWEHTKWVCKDKIVHTYDEFGKTTEEIIYGPFNGIFGISDINEYVYDSKDRCKRTNTWRFSHETQDYYLFKYTVWYYSDLTGIKGVKSDPEIKVYPNPATDYITLATNEPGNIIFRLFDLNGKKLFEKTISFNQSFPIDWIASGVYIYQAILRDKVYKGKLIKR